MTTPRRPLPHHAFTECWYVSGETHIVDLIHPDDGLTLYFKLDAEAVRGRYPNARRVDCDEAFAAIEIAARATYLQDVTEIDEARFMDALGVLPPVGWTTRGGVESFRISERLWGNITTIFARLDQRFFMLADDIRLPADEIARRVREFAAAHPVAPERPTDGAGRTGAPLPSPKPGDGA